MQFPLCPTVLIDSPDLSYNKTFIFDFTNLLCIKYFFLCKNGVGKFHPMLDGSLKFHDLHFFNFLVTFASTGLEVRVLGLLSLYELWICI